jgi:hypothetical protein
MLDDCLMGELGIINQFPFLVTIKGGVPKGGASTHFTSNIQIEFIIYY